MPKHRNDLNQGKFQSPKGSARHNWKKKWKKSKMHHCLYDLKRQNNLQIVLMDWIIIRKINKNIYYFHGNSNRKKEINQINWVSKEDKRIVILANTSE